ncbi:MAG: tetratricopeptide repeat protein [Bacteroidia bacterium]
MSISLIALHLKNLIVLVFLFFSLLSSGNTNLDSLYSIIHDDSQDETTRLNSLEHLIQYYLYNQPDSAYILTEQQLKLASAKKRLSYKVMAINSQGIVLKLNGEYAQAMKLFEQGLNLAEPLQYKKGIADALTNIGELFMIQNNYDSAQKKYNKSLKLSREIDYAEGIVNNLTLIGDVHRHEHDYAKALEYYQQGQLLSDSAGYKNGLGKSLNSVGIIYWIQSNYTQALRYFLRGMSQYKDANNKYGEAMVRNNIGNIYGEQGKFSEALEYYEQALELMEGFGDKRRIAGFLNNMAYAKIGLDKYSESLEYYEKSNLIYEEMADQPGLAENLNNVGSVYSDLGDYAKALEYSQRSLAIAKADSNKSIMASALISIGKYYNRLGERKQAVESCKAGLQLSVELDIPFRQKTACACLYNSYKAMGNNKDALKYHELLTSLEWSMQTDETTKQLKLMEFQKISLKDSVERAEEKRITAKKHQDELDKKDKTRNVLFGAGLAMLLLAGGFFNRWRYVNRSRAIITKEKERSEELLLNILPAEIAEELKEKGSADAQEFDLVSIVFTDFKGFTQASEQLSAKQVVETVHACFKAFDEICETHNLEKIKTIGDAYMAAGGLPIPSPDAVKNTILAALEMQRFIPAFKRLMIAQNQPSFDMRVGIHTGPVVAGIVGVKKFQYDIWGDTVNTAARMESHGEIGKVNITKDTYELLKDDSDFSFEHRGKIKAKGKGEVEMYFVELANGKDDKESTK